MWRPAGPPPSRMRAAGKSRRRQDCSRPRCPAAGRRAAGRTGPGAAGAAGADREPRALSAQRALPGRTGSDRRQRALSGRRHRSLNGDRQGNCARAAESVHRLGSERQRAGGLGGGEGPVAGGVDRHVDRLLPARLLNGDAHLRVGGNGRCRGRRDPARDGLARHEGQVLRRRELGLVQEQLELHGGRELGEGVLEGRGDGEVVSGRLAGRMGAHGEVAADPGPAGVSPAGLDVPGQEAAEGAQVRRLRWFARPPRRCRFPPPGRRTSPRSVRSGTPPGPRTGQPCR